MTYSVILYSLASVLLASVIAGWFVSSPPKAILAGWATMSAYTAFLGAGAPGLGRTLVGLLLASLFLLGCWTAASRLKSRSASPPDARGGSWRPIFIRHWQGSLPLSHAYANVATLALGLMGLAGLLKVSPIARAPRLVSLGILSSWVLGILATCWALVGLWRCISTRARSGGSKVLTWVSRVVVVLLVLLGGTIVDIYAKPVWKEHVPCAFGPSERSLYRIRVLREGTEVELSGSLGFGAGADLARVLDEHPRIRIVHLNSSGGRMFEGQRIAQLVLDRGLITYTTVRCESACVTVFAGGVERWLGPRAVLGLHGPHSETSTKEELQRWNAEIRSYLVGRGVDPAFVDKGLSVSSREAWQPSPGDLLASRLATRLVDPENDAPLDLDQKTDR